MIEVEDKLYSYLAPLIRERFKGIYVTDLYVPKASTYPCWYFHEDDNSTADTATSSSNENHVDTMYTVEITSNKVNGENKRECKKIRDYTDKLMLDMGFVRMMSHYVPNANNATVYRIITRYVGRVSKDYKVYQR